MNNRKKIVITGASGFLGSHLVERLKDDEKYIVYALSSRPDELKEKNGGAAVVYLHKDAFKESGEFLKDAIVVNCAYPRNSTGTVIADGLKYVQGVFEAAVENRASAIINISSQSVYSQTREEAATEETPLSLDNAYAVGKYATELMLESICEGTEIKYTNLRMASLIGPGFDQRIVNRFVKQALEGNSLKIVKSDQRFGFLDIEDAVRAVISLLQTPTNIWRLVYNAGNNKGYTIEEILQSIIDVFKERGIERPSVVYEDGTGAGNTIVSYITLNSDTGFEPKVNLHESVDRIVQTLRIKKCE